MVSYKWVSQEGTADDKGNESVKDTERKTLISSHYLFYIILFNK